MTGAVTGASRHTCVPLLTAVVSQLIEYGDVVSSTPRLCAVEQELHTRTPTSSDALADKVDRARTVAPASAMSAKPSAVCCPAAE